MSPLRHGVLFPIPAVAAVGNLSDIELASSRVWFHSEKSTAVSSHIHSTPVIFLN